MLTLLMNGRIDVFILLLIAIVISLSFHEFGHAWMAKQYGDRTAEMQGRLTVNPMAHIDPMGLLMVMIVGFGYAKPVPTDPRNFTSPSASAVIAFAGPAMNLLLAIVVLNGYVLAVRSGVDYLAGSGQQIFFLYFVKINLLLMVFNLIPLGPLDGHYIMSSLLPPRLSYRYDQFNHRYGSMLLMGLILLSFVGVPIFSYLMSFSEALLRFVLWV